MRDALVDLGKYCRAWLWAVGVMVVGPFLFVAIVAKRGAVALWVRHQRQAAPALHVDTAAVSSALGTLD